MKTRIILCAGLLLITCITQAQVSKESFDKAVDLLNCRTVELSLKKDNAANIQDFLKKNPCSEVSYEQINAFLTSDSKYDATIDLAREIQSLKDRKYNKNLKKEAAIDMLTYGIFIEDAYPRIVSFGRKRKDNPDFNTYKEDLKNELSVILKEVDLESPVTPTAADIKPASSELEERVSAIEKQQAARNEEGWLNGITMPIVVAATLIALFFSILTLFISSRVSKRDNGDIPENFKKYVKQKISTEMSAGQQYAAINSPEIRNAINKIKELEIKINNIHSPKNDAADLPDITQQVPVPGYQEVKPDVRAEVFFLSTPNADGSFNESSISATYREGASIYRFVKTEQYRAKFQIDEKEASVKMALQYPDKNIDPVCDAENAFNPKAKRITTVNPGEAQLQGDKWIKTTKAKIRYEN